MLAAGREAQRRDRRGRHPGRAHRRRFTSSTCIISARPTRLRCRCRVAADDGSGVTRRHGPRGLRGGLSGLVQPFAPGTCRCASCRCESRRSAGGRRSTSRCLRPIRRLSLDKARAGIARGLVRRAAGARRSVWSRLDLPAGTEIAGTRHSGAARRHSFDRTWPDFAHRFAGKCDGKSAKTLKSQGI